MSRLHVGQFSRFLKMFCYTNQRCKVELLYNHSKKRRLGPQKSSLSFCSTVGVQRGLINSKKIQKNVKFGLQPHINMENKMNSSDRSFGHWKRKNEFKVFTKVEFWEMISHDLFGDIVWNFTVLFYDVKTACRSNFMIFEDGFLC